MPRLTAADAARVAGGRVTGDPDAQAATFVFDSRLAGPGTAFVGLPGASAPTGIEHVAAALDAGASFCLCDREPPRAPAVVVDDLEDALTRLASWWRDRLDVRVVAVTGSTGKTTTKDLLAAALGASFRVHATPKSFNAELGVPLTVLGCGDEAEVMVCELAARHPGEIGGLARIVRPAVAVVTGIGVAHLGEFGSREAIARTKSELVESLDATGVAVLPAADDFLALLCSKCAGRVVTVGRGGAVRPVRVEIGRDARPVVAIALAGGERAAFRMPVPGRALVRNGAMAVAAARELGVPAEDAARAIEDAPTSAARMHVVACRGRVLVNDAYNANPTSALSAVRTVAEIADGRPAWALLAQMAELGPIADEQHLRLGHLAARLGFDRVVAIGAQAARIADGAGPAGTRVADADEALELAQASPDDAVVLVKGSLVAGLQRLASRLEDAWCPGEVA